MREPTSKGFVKVTPDKVPDARRGWGWESEPGRPSGGGDAQTDSGRSSLDRGTSTTRKPNIQMPVSSVGPKHRVQVGRVARGGTREVSGGPAGMCHQVRVSYPPPPGCPHPPQVCSLSAPLSTTLSPAAASLPTPCALSPTPFSSPGVSSTPPHTHMRPRVLPPRGPGLGPVSPPQSLTPSPLRRPRVPGPVGGRGPAISDSEPGGNGQSPVPVQRQQA